MDEELTITNTYETIIIFNGNLKEEEYNKKVMEWFHTITTDDSAKIPTRMHKVDKLGLKNLAYEVKKCKQGWYVVFTYSTHPSRIPELERLMRIDDDIIKFLTVRMETDDIPDDIDLEESIDEQSATTEESVEETKPTEIDAFDLIFG